MCGDGIVVEDTHCEDNNSDNGDGCSKVCNVEQGWICTYDDSESTCVQICGDGIIVAGEICDDSNTDGDDGCSSKCQVESGWSCDNSSGVSICSETCGDAILTQSETCDPIIQSPACINCRSVEEHWICDDHSCYTTCGDGLRLGQEVCDDGNTIDGDGCSK